MSDKAERKVRVVAIVSKGKRQVYIERPANEWESIKTSNSVGEDHKRRFKGDVIVAFLIGSDNSVIDKYISMLPNASSRSGWKEKFMQNIKKEEILFPDERQAV